MRLCFLLLFAACTLSPPAPDELPARLFAPCCWRQTLADHSSPLATQLRAEIRERLAAGEPPAAIEAALVARYGERVRAVGAPGGRDPRTLIAIVGGIAALVGLTLVGRMLRPARPAPLLLVDEDADLAARLDDELAQLDV